MNKANELIELLLNEVADRVAERLQTTQVTTTQSAPRYYTRKEAAGLLRLSLPTLLRLTKDGLITAKRIGGRVLYEAEAIDAAVRENRTFRYLRK